MGQPAKRNGRLVDKLISMVEWHISQAETALLDDMHNPDPWKHIEKRQDALVHLKKARTAALSISEICMLARQRGSYKKEKEAL